MNVRCLHQKFQFLLFTISSPQFLLLFQILKPSCTTLQCKDVNIEQYEVIAAISFVMSSFIYGISRLSTLLPKY